LALASVSCAADEALVRDLIIDGAWDRNLIKQATQEIQLVEFAQCHQGTGIA